MLVDVAQKHDLFLIGDEAYHEFVYGGGSSRLASLPTGRDNIIVIDTVSKRFSACGARIRLPDLKNKGVHEPRDEMLPSKTFGRDARPDRLPRSTPSAPVFAAVLKQV